MRSTFCPPENLSRDDPTYTASTGPVWQLAAEGIIDGEHAGGRPYLVRRLTNVQSMLSVGPMLEQITRFDHSHLWGPSWWTRGDEGVWIATIKPRGFLLETGDLERCSWSEALQLWRPIAEAVTRLHGRGLVHGALAPWTVWIDETTRKATAIDIGCWVGDDLAHLDDQAAIWIAPEMARARQARDPRPATDVYGLARLLIRLALPSAQAAEARPNFSGIPAYAIPALEAALSEEPSRRPPRVAELVSATAPRSLHRPDGQPDQAAYADDDTVSVFHARVSDIDRIEHPRRGPGIKFFVHRHNTPAGDDTGQPDRSPHGGRTGAFFYKEQTPEVFDAIKRVWEGCELNLLDARLVENSAGRQFLTAQPTTLAILEPHMPISVSNVLKAEGCPSRFLVDQRDSGESSRPLVFGNLVHSLLDDLVAADPPDFQTAFDAQVRDLRLDMLAAGLSDRDLGELETDARQHFDNIKRFTAPRTDEAADRDRVGWSGRNVEVTRYSTRYGIEGRVDLVAQAPREGLQIVELKSGSTWDGHLSQLRFYKMLWDGLAEARGMQVTGHVLYSRHGRMKTAPMEDTRRERRILHARNELIACLRSFVDPAYEYQAPFFMQYPRACRAPSCKFRRQRCGAQTAVVGLADDASPWEAADGAHWDGVAPEVIARAWAWHDHFSRLVEMERWASTAEMGKVLHPGRLDERKQDYHAVDDLELYRVDVDHGTIEFRGGHGQIFSSGDYLVAHRGDFHTSHILRGRVVEVGAETTTLATRTAAIASQLPNRGWILDKLPARLGFRQAHHALYRALEHSGPDRLEVLFRPDSGRARTLASPGDDPPSVGQTAPHTLNPSQTRAVQLAISAPGGGLVQGPPGTGKTTVIAHAVRELVDRGQRVLVSAFTNTAVDTILLKLLEIDCDDFLRIGRSSKSPELRRALERHGHTPEEIFSDDRAAQTVSLDVLGDDILDQSVIASTTHRCVSSPVVEFLDDQRGPIPFDVAIVDEAGQITEPMTVAAVNLGRRFILVGDHRQLPPIVENEQTHSNFIDELGHQELADMGCQGLDRSLFERLVDQLPEVMLDEQYRMHADIMSFANRRFYDGRLAAHPTIADRTLTVAQPSIDGLADPLDQILRPDHPLVFADVDHDGRGRHNWSEAAAVVDAVAALVQLTRSESTDPAEPTIGVVSPFRAQVYLIRRLLADHPDVPADRIDVDTVERFQGSERDVIVVSLVKAERAGDFLADERRLNVTVTRAKKKLIVFGNRACLELNSLYRELIEQPETHLVNWPS